MKEAISASDVYDKNLNFLIGAGASAGLLPTLALKIKKDGGANWTLEGLATHFEKANDSRYIPLFMHYYLACIRPAQKFSVKSAAADATPSVVVENYRTFLGTILQILRRRNALERTCNLFTTNYDGCIPFVADEILREGTVDFLLNDGARGFRRRYLQVRNFDTFLCQTGVFERHRTSIPQINLMHVHGSVYWQKDGTSIVVDYELSGTKDLLDDDARERLKAFSDCLNNPESTLQHLEMPKFSKEELDLFWDSYERLPVVNPTKWKFHETVFEEHYYQMLRTLSYELEKPNAVLITFGFSFADEHIFNLLKRSLSNPSLQVFICCYSQSTKDTLQARFAEFPNVRCIALEDTPMGFAEFNHRVFSVDALQPPSVAVVANPAPAPIANAAESGAVA